VKSHIFSRELGWSLSMKHKTL